MGGGDSEESYVASRVNDDIRIVQSFNGDGGAGSDEWSLRRWGGRGKYGD